MTTRSKRVLSPFDGQIKNVRNMVAEDVFLLNEGDRIAWVCQWAETDRVYSDSCYVLFDEQLVLYSGRAKYDTSKIASLLFDALKGIAAQTQRFANHVRQGCVTIGVTEFFCPHIGHYIWNCVSGWEKFFDYGGGAHADFYSVHSNCQTLGSVGALYAREVVSPDRVLTLDSNVKLQSIMLDRRAMIMTIKDNHVTQGLASRVTAWSYAALDRERLQSLQDFRESCELIAILTIRLDNRSWVNQVDGWPRLVNELTRLYPGIGFVIDGINGDAVQGWTHGYMSARAELDLAEQIIRNCPQTKIYNSINCTVQESMVLADLADFLIAHVGAGMAKHRWIANLPTVAFSNRSFSAPGSHDGRLYDHFRDDPIQAVHVPAEAVDDIVEGRAVGWRANFHLDWREVLGLTVQICQERMRVKSKSRLKL